MKELENHKADKPEIEKIAPINKVKIHKKLFPLPGHRIFELELATGFINEVKPEGYSVRIVPEIDIRTGKITGTTTQKEAKIKRRDGCLYVTALRASTADKHFHAMIGKPYKKKK